MRGEYWFNPSILHHSQIHMVRHCIIEWVTQGFLIRMASYIIFLLMVASYVCNHSCRHSLIGRTPIRAVQVRLLLVTACKIHMLYIGRHILMWLSSCGDMNYYESERKLTPQQNREVFLTGFTQKQKPVIYYQKTT